MTDSRRRHQEEQEPRQDAPEAASTDPGADGQTQAQAGSGDGQTPAADAGATAAPQQAAGSDDVSTLRDRHLRLAAEFDNYRKRVERERAEAWNRAQAELASKLLDVLDDLQRVAHYNPETATAQSLLEGTQMVERKLTRVLEAAGVEAIEPAGEPFDPAVHEALMTVPTEAREEDNSVADVFQKGYRLKGTLLRPARVRVKKYEG